jgi:hypothetical protein
VKEVRMTPDESYAVLLLAFLLVTVTQKKFAQFRTLEFKERVQWLLAFRTPVC